MKDKGPLPGKAQEGDGASQRLQGRGARWPQSLGGGHTGGPALEWVAVAFRPRSQMSGSEPWFPRKLPEGPLHRAVSKRRASFLEKKCVGECWGSGATMTAGEVRHFFKLFGHTFQGILLLRLGHLRVAVVKTGKWAPNENLSLGPVPL